MLAGGLALAPLALAAEALALPQTPLFVLAAAALAPLAWLIGVATEHAARHSGPAIGGFLNATFGNAPELIIALIAAAHGLSAVVLGSLSGSVVANLLLVLGFALLVGGRTPLDRRSTFTSLLLVAVAGVAVLAPSIAGWQGNPQRHALAVLSLPLAIVLLILYAGVTVPALRRHHSANAAHAANNQGGGWSLRKALLVLAAASVLIAFLADAVVRTLSAFADSAGVSPFFTAAVVVAIVGNAAEHGGAVVVAARGQVRLASEIALASSAQVAVFIVPAVAVAAWATEPLALSFRPVELVALGGAIVGVAVVLADGNSARWKGAALIAGYVAAAVAFFVAA